MSYVFKEYNNGFSISKGDINLYIILIDNISLKLERDDKISTLYKNQRSYGLYETDTLLTNIVHQFYQNWHPKENTKWLGVKNWAEEKTKISLSKRFYQYWRTLITKANPIAVQIQKSMFAATGKKELPHLLKDYYFYYNSHIDISYIYQDIINYRAAAIATYHIINDHGLYRRNGNRTDENLIEKLKNWMNYYSDIKVPYTSLTKTLMNLPGNIPINMLRNFSEIHLVRPVFTRSELIAHLSLGEYPKNHINSDIIYKATPKQIKAAMYNLGRIQHIELQFRKSLSIKHTIRFCLDYRERHNGNLVGLCQKSVDWHFEQQRNQYQSVLDKYDQNMKLPEPDFILPENFVFINTVGKLVEEGNLMQHCIASYADELINHNSGYVFHVNYKNSQATTLYYKDTKSIISYGPMNHSNEASEYSNIILSQYIHEKEQI